MTSFLTEPLEETDGAASAKKKKSLKVPFEKKRTKTCRFHCYLGLFIRYAPSYLCLMILTSKWLFKQQATPNSVFPLFQVMARTILNIGRQDKVTFYKYIIVLFK